MSENLKIAKIVSESETGAVFQGVGDKEVETHFTFVKGKGFHVSTYLNNNLLDGSGTGNEKVKFEQIDLGS